MAFSCSASELRPRDQDLWRRWDSNPGPITIDLRSAVRRCGQGGGDGCTLPLSYAPKNTGDAGGSNPVDPKVLPGNHRRSVRPLAERELPTERLQLFVSPAGFEPAASAFGERHSSI
jgi:hypothetical protein